MAEFCYGQASYLQVLPDSAWEDDLSSNGVVDQHMVGSEERNRFMLKCSATKPMEERSRGRKDQILAEFIELKKRKRGILH